MKNSLLKIFTMCLAVGFLFPVQAKESLVGVLKNSSGTRSASLYFAMEKGQASPLEVSEVDAEGNFVFHYRPKAVGCYTLQFENAKSVLCVLRPGQTVSLTIDARTGMFLKTANSDENTLLLNYHQSLIDLDARKKKLVEAHRKKENPDFQQQMAALEKERLAAVVSLCEANPDNYASAVLLEYLDVDFYASTYETVLTPLCKKYRKDAFLSHKWEQLQASQRVAPGNIAPDFTLSDLYGKQVSLSSYKGKVVLLDFWASWCPDCRRASPYMRYLYRKYHDKGLEIVGVSLDNDRERWYSGVQTDSLQWTQLSSLQRWECPVAKAYNIHWIPTLVLIDRDGRIVARRLEGEELESKIRSLLP
ncbi:MAG: TlpA family protein disulfide reductase [Bacteroidales bacterium]|nr:TlpA family protein disulfide reductase [Bacteroidales bacterium]